MTAPVGSLAAYLSVRGAAQARQDILSVQRQLGLAGEAASVAGGAMDRSEAAIAGVGRASTAASSRANQLRAAQLGVVSATERYNAVLADENATVGKLATSEASLIRSKERLASVTRVAAATQAQATEGTRAAALANSEMVASSSRGVAAMGGTVKQLGLMLGGFELLKKGIDIAKETADFQRNMLLIQTNANASAAEVANMTAAVLKLAPEVATSPDELANALYHVEQNGLRGKEALEALRVGAEGAKIGMADVEDTTNTMTIALASGIEGMGSMQKAMGTMIAIAGTGDMRLKDLNEALSGGILSVAKGFGATLGDVAAVLATLGDNGVRGTDAAQALRQTLMGFASPAAKGKEALEGIGLTMTSLAKDMEKHGLVHAMNDLEKHMNAAGVTGAKVGSFITTAFGRKAGAGLSVLMGEIDRVNIKFEEGQKGAAGFADKWDETTKTASFAFKKLGVEVEAAGIKVATGALPALTGIGNVLGVILPAAFHAAAAGMTPFVAGWHVLADILPPVGHALADVGGFLAPLLPALKFVAADVIAMWVAFKGYQAARYAINAMVDMFGMVKAKAVTGLASVQAYGSGVNATLSGNATEAQLTSRIMQAEFAKIEASALTTAAAIDRAAAMEAVAFADTTAASKVASDAQVTAADRAAAAALAQARISAQAATVTTIAAEESAVAVTTAGETAAVGWMGVLGPLAAVGLGVGLLVSMFHHSSTASKEAAQAAKDATEAAKGYADVLHSGGGPGEVLGVIVQHLADKNVPLNLAAMNRELAKDGFGKAAVSGKEFLAAIQGGNPALAKLRKELQLTITAGTLTLPTGSGVTTSISESAKHATKLLAALNSEYGGLTKAARKEIADFKGFGQVVTPIGGVAEKLHVASDSAKQYANMMGFAVTKNGNVVGSAKDAAAAIATVGKAYNNATQSGDLFLTAVDAFSKSPGTAADRGALIGATLRAANGDALSFAGAMTGTYAASKALADGFQADADKIAGLKDQINQLQHPMEGQTVDAKALAKAQNDLTDAYANSERAAINLNKGTIDYAKGGAPALVGQLQSIQDSAVKAAGALYQHELATKGGTVAANDAYKLYVNQTSGALDDEQKKLNLTDKQAGKLSKTYFGMPKNIKTLIKAEGTDPIVTVLTKIGKLLAKFTGQSWDIPVNVMVNTVLGIHKSAHVDSSGQAIGPGIATGGYISGSGPKGIDSQLRPVAVGEYMMNDKAVDKYGLGFMASVNAGTFRMPSGGGSVGASPFSGGERSVVIHKLEVNQNYPRPDTGQIALPHAMRAAGLMLGGLG